MSRRIIQLPVTLGGVVRKVDRSVSMRFTTSNEVSNDDFATLDTFMGHSGFLLFSENELQAEDVPKENAPLEVGQKKPSVRLRAVLWRIWETKTDQSEPFDTSYYPRIMEKLIERYKAELE